MNRVADCPNANAWQGGRMIISGVLRTAWLSHLGNAARWDTAHPSLFVLWEIRPRRLRNLSPVFGQRSPIVAFVCILPLIFSQPVQQPPATRSRRVKPCKNGDNLLAMNNLYPFLTKTSQATLMRSQAFPPQHPLCRSKRVKPAYDQRAVCPGTEPPPGCPAILKLANHRRMVDYFNQ